MVRLGEFRTKTRDFDNKLIIKLCEYHKEGNIIKDVEIDMVNDHEIYLRCIDEL